jgi:ABC-type Na+ efflux pump permease subunit
MKMIVVIFAFISLIFGYLLIWAAAPFFTVLLVLKAINFQGIFWFGWPETVAVFTTPLWLVLGGLIFIITAIVLATMVDMKINFKKKKRYSDFITIHNELKKDS